MMIHVFISYMLILWHVSKTVKRWKNISVNSKSCGMILLILKKGSHAVAGAQSVVRC